MPFIAPILAPIAALTAATRPVLHTALQPPTIAAAKLATAPTIDGTINDDEWAGASTFDGLVDAGNGAPAPDGNSGRFYLASDERFIYFAARLTDPDPTGIHATEYRTNVEMPGDDTVGIQIDLSGSLNDFNEFSANPRGATRLELTGGRAAKREWTGEIVARGRVTATGWELEMRIPWAILPIPAAGARDLRFNVERYIARLNRKLTYRFIDSGKSGETPIWRGVMLPAPALDHRLKLLPYFYSGAQARGALVMNGGLDVKTNLSDQIQLVGTVNPDFRNVESAILSLDFSRFARIADETRPFFQEGADYIGSSLFTSQTIQKVDVGVNTYGKLNDKTQFGLLNTVDFGNERDLVASAGYAPGPNDNFRFALTQRNRHATSQAPGSDNYGFLERYYASRGPWNVFARLMQSDDSLIGSGSDSTVRLNYSKTGVFGGFGYDRRSATFAPGLGFYPETDFKGFRGYAGLERSFNRGLLQSVNIFSNVLDYHRVSGETYRRGYSMEGNLVGRNRVSLGFGVDRPVFEGSHDHTDSVSVGYPAGDPYRNGAVGYSWGVISGKSYRLASANGAYRLFNRLQLTASAQQYRLGPDNQTQVILGGNYDLGNDRSVSGRVVQSGGHTNTYVAFRRSGNRGAEYYAIFGDPSATTSQTSFVLKVIAPIQPG